MEATVSTDNPLGSTSDPGFTTSRSGIATGDYEARLSAQEERLAAQGEQIATLLQGATNPAAVMARLESAPTNWHQAMVYFLTSKAAEDTHMRRRVPLMYAGSLLMVTTQIIATYGLLVAMLVPACNSNSHCNDRTGFFCYESPVGHSGNCKMCGQAAPLPYYLSNERIPGCEGGCTEGPYTYEYKEYNVVWDQHYKQGFMGKRSTTPEAFAGYNFTMIKETCTRPIRSFRWKYEGRLDSTVVTDRGDLPAWIPNERIQPRGGESEYSTGSVARWCNACVQPSEFDEGDGLMQSDPETGLAVSIMNNRLLALNNLRAMSFTDWVALMLCSYLVGLTVFGEIKDILLCELSAQRNLSELSLGWQRALAVLSRLRSQFFLQPLMGAIPAVVLTQGGSAMAICFNTIVRKGIVFAFGHATR
jgi:hypothetical protein